MGDFERLEAKVDWLVSAVHHILEQEIGDTSVDYDEEFAQVIDEDVTQGAFVALARSAPQLTDRVVLTGWLHRTAQNIAAQTVRTDMRRRAREQEAAAMNELLAHESDATWEHIAPHLDDALGALGEADRDALMLRYFERKSAQEMAQVLGISTEAAQKRVTRAVERLREFFAERSVTVGASGLAVFISANAVQAAPVGLSATIASVATLAGVTVSTVTSTTSATQAIAMTTLQKTLVGTVLVAAISVAVFQTREAARLRDANREHLQQQAALAEEIDRLKSEHAAANGRVAALANQTTTPRTNSSELLKLRGQVGVLRQEKADLGRKSALSKVTADPTARKAMRDAQRMGMKSLYGDMVKRLGLAPEQQEKFHDLLADDVMENIDLITQSLQDKSGKAEIDRLFSAQESALRDKLAALLGPDSATQYNEYTKDLAGTLTTVQFESNLTGEKAVKAEKKQKLMQFIREETGAALAAAGLPADYQSLPMLNFRNIASGEAAEDSLKLMGDVFGRVSERADAFLSPEEMKQLQEFGKQALENNRAMLLMNRKMMAPIAE